MTEATVLSEARKYRDLYTHDFYKATSPGVRYVPLFLDMAGHPIMHRGTVLDAGCGTGKGALALREAGFMPSLVDLTDEGLCDEAKALQFTAACLWEPLAPRVGFHDWVFCCDVLEHIPTHYVMLTLARLLEVARKGLFLSICHRQDGYGEWVGERLHLTVESFEWWRDRLNEVGAVVEARDLLGDGVYLVRP